jgi:tyrosyl-tRNA synthetase
MSKSLGNYIGITEEPSQIFGKVMSISDELMWRYYTLVTDLTPAGIAELREGVEAGRVHPMQAKRDLAKLIISEFHSAADAAAAEESFRRVFSERQVPADVEEKQLPASAEPQLLAKVLAAAALADSNKDAQRLIAQGGVLVDDEKVDNVKHALDASAGRSYVVKVGKRRFAKIVFG